jgi:hypothetical protein
MRRATIRTELADADAVAAALTPDNTPEMSTRVEDDTVVTTVERETTGGLQSTVDDYVVNLSVAKQVVQTARQSDHINYE